MREGRGGWRAYGNDDDGERSGSAYLFDVTSGEQLAKLVASDDTAGASFGRSVAIGGTTAVVGAWGDEDNGDQSGSTYLLSIVPEPGSFLLATLGLLTLVAGRRSRPTGERSSPRRK